MDKPTKIVVNCSTGEETIEFLTEEEIHQMEIDNQRWLEEKERRAAEAEAKAAAKASALAKLAALGLTAEEAAAIAG